ncbi:hypothetical protein [Shewanella algae]|uniref:hypothetical protein n=1 Tax=Shewanella algae TaxID=38313 RepID=UPI0006D0A691
MEVTNWIVAIAAIISIVITVALPLLSYLNSTNNATRQELADHKTHVAENYATKDDMRNMVERLERHMDKQFEQLRTDIKDKAA